MSVIDKAKDHFRDRVAGEAHSIDVPEWDTVIYYKPMSMKLKIELGKYIDNPFEYAVRAVLLRALDSDLNRMFRPADRTDMVSGVDPDVIERIVLEMSEDVEDVEKN